MDKEKDVIKEYFKKCTKYLDGATWESVENSLKYRVVPFTGIYTIPLRSADGNLTYFCNREDGMSITGKYIGYSRPPLLRFQGLPIPDEVNSETLKRTVNKVVEILSMGSRVDILLNYNELKILINVLGKLPYKIEYYDSDFYDDIDEFIEKHKSGKGRQRLRGMLGDENVIFRDIEYSDYSQLKKFVSNMEAEKGKEYYRGKFYETLIADWSLYGYKLYGLFYKDKLMYVMGLWTTKEVARADMIMCLKTDEEFEKLNIPKRYRRGCEYTFKYILYTKLKEIGIKLLSVDGVGYKIDKGEGLREHKTERYNREMKIYRLRGIDE